MCRQIPVYQRSGTIVPTKERPRRASAHQAADPYTLTVALDETQTATGSLYTDDGATFQYRDSQHVYRRLSFENNTLKSRCDAAPGRGRRPRGGGGTRCLASLTTAATLGAVTLIHRTYRSQSLDHLPGRRKME